MTKGGNSSLHKFLAVGKISENILVGKVLSKVQKLGEKFLSWEFFTHESTTPLACVACKVIAL